MLQYRESIGRTRRQQEERTRMRAEIEAEQQQKLLDSQNMSHEHFHNSTNHKMSKNSYQAPIFAAENLEPLPEDSRLKRNNIEQFVSNPNYGQIFYREDSKDKYTNEYLSAALDKERRKFNELQSFLKKLAAQNKQLRSQQGFNTVKSGFNGFNGRNEENEEWLSMTPEVRQIVKQKFQQLKEDNDQLRKITVSLLKTQTPINTLGNTGY